ncbi:chitinase-3-like protein 1 [Mizuhopecten yessoensis]|uniref:chitinase-3-like protein 1 n=1 Tax=Mizuhopecten yessoensis TaxID=6573 RepID=UPI000B4586D3|nr:chitinase-3-like protein 1 [Mizuhopecten yessoensis]
MTSNSTNQTAFISTIIPFLKTYNFDGFVLEWEGSSSGFKAMSTELRQAFDLDGTGLMLVCNLFGPTIDDFNTKYDLNTVKETVMNYDFITLQTYSLIEDYSSVPHHSRRVARSDATGASYFLNLAKWIVEEGYGGAAIYTLGDDDFNQDCTSSEVPFPLISTAKGVFEEATAPKEYRRVCYFTTWAELRTGAGIFTADDIDPSLCTHIIVAFAEISDECELEVSDVNDTLIYERVIALKTNNTDLKVLLSVGGWVQASESFSYMVSRPKQLEYILLFIMNILQANLGFLLLRRTYEEEAQNNSIPCLLLTAAVAAEQEYIDYAYDVKALAK